METPYAVRERSPGERRSLAACPSTRRRGRGGPAPIPAVTGGVQSRLESSGTVLHLQLPSEPSRPLCPVPKTFSLGSGNDGKTARRLRSPKRHGGMVSSATWLSGPLFLLSSARRFLQKRQNCCLTSQKQTGPRHTGKNPCGRSPSRPALEQGDLSPNRCGNKH